MFNGKVISALEEAAGLNRTDPLRNSQMLCFPGAGDLFVAGDLHNHTRNYEKFVKAAALEKNLQRHVIFQEIIHGGALGPSGEDRSLEMLLQALELQRRFPGRVHFLLANHDLAQVQKLPIMKDGYDLTDRFSRYFEVRFRSDAAAIQKAFGNFVHSMPLAAITVTGIFLSHSLPAERDMATFDPALLRRELTETDYARNGSVFQLVWGRHQSQQVLDTLSRAWWADIFVCGHQSFDSGSHVIGDRLLIIDSSHNHGTYLRIDLARQYTFSDLAATVQPLASIG